MYRTLAYVTKNEKLNELLQLFPNIDSKSEATTARQHREFIECAFFELKFSIVR